MVDDNQFDIEDSDEAPVPSKHLRVLHAHPVKSGLSPEDERALQDVLQGFRYTWKAVAWVFKAIMHGVIAAISGLVAAGLIKHFM